MTNPRNKKTKTEDGSTLIEILLYIAIFSILIASVLSAVYQILDSRKSYLARIDVEEESNFLIKKNSLGAKQCQCRASTGPGRNFHNTFS